MNEDFFARQDANRVHIRRYSTDEQQSVAEKRSFRLDVFELIDYTRTFIKGSAQYE